MSFCFLDMDGVLADFVAGVCAAHNRPSPYDDSASFGVFDMDKLWGMTPREFWAPCDGESFWDDLPKTPEADRIVGLAYDHFGPDNVAVLTSPSMSPYCVPGKRRWLRKHFPGLEKSAIFSSAKRFLAGPDRVLIDDRDKNIDDFNAAGGVGVLVPRPWNREHKQSGLPVFKLIRKLSEWRAAA